MSKKILKILALLVSVAAFVAGIIYFINKKKKEAELLEEEDDFEFEVEEDHIDAMDALDLSSLQFSRHYVDLR